MFQRTLLFAAALVLIPLLPAQDAPSAAGAAPAPAPAVEAPQKAPSLLDRRFDLDYAGGTLEKLLTAVESALGERPNFVLGPGCGEATLPAFSLRNVSASLLFDAIEDFLDEYRIRTSSRKGEVIVFMKKPEQRSSRGTAFGYSPRQVEPFDLAPFLTTFTIDDIVTSVETAWQMLEEDEEGTPASLRYHAETNLLLVAGENTQISVVHDILGNLQQQIQAEENRKQTAEMDRLERARRETARRDQEVQKAADKAADK